MLTASFSDGPAFHTRSCTQSTSDSTSALHTDTAPHISQDATTTPKPLTADHLDALFRCKGLALFANAFPEDC